VTGPSQIKLTKKQSKVFNSLARFRVLIAGRRFGKTFLSVAELLRVACNKKEAICWYVAPTYKMAKRLAWKRLKKLTPKSIIDSKNETDLTITLINGSVIALHGADKPDSLRGDGLDFVIFDEFADINQEAWEEVINPALTDKEGSALFIGTPKGYNWAYELFKKAKELPNWCCWQYTTAQGGNVKESEIQRARDTMDSRKFRQEMLATFEALADRVYDQFERTHNVKPVDDLPATKDYAQPVLLVGMDFNILPMSAVLAIRNGTECHVFDNIELPVSNTEEMAAEIRRRYPERQIIVCPDPSGKARKTSAPVGQTDFTILQRYGFYIQAPNAAPLVVDRINNTQAMLCTESGLRRLLINPRCEALIKCLDGLTYVDGRPDKKSGLDHLTDALGYLLWMQFNLLEQNTWTVGTVEGGGY